MVKDLLSKPTKIFTFSGVPVYLEPSFVILLIVMLILSPQALLTILSLFAIVILHEFGHVLSAKHLGYQTDKILLNMFGGMAMINGDWIEKPRHSLFITCCGPLVNLVLAGLLLPFWEFSFLNQLMWFNLYMFIFNMLPLPVLDGSKILFSLMYLRSGNPIQSVNNLTIVCNCTTFLAGCFFLWHGNIFMLMMVVMLFMLGRQERAWMRDHFSGIKHAN